MVKVAMNKKGRFMPFWILFGLLGIFLIGSFITPFKIVLDDVFENIETNSVNEADTKLSCTSDDAYWFMKATCFTLGGFMVIFVLYLLYQWVSAVTAGSMFPGPILSPRLNLRERLSAEQS